MKYFYKISFLVYSGVWERFSQGYKIPFIPEVILSNLFEVFGATSNNFFHPRLISPDLFWCVGVSASQEKIPSPITKCTGIKAASIRLTCFWSGFLSLNVSIAINLEAFAFWHITGFLTEGVPQSYSITLFHLLPLPFPGGSRGSPPGNFSLSSYVNLQIDIRMGVVPQSYSITLLLTAITIPWGVQGVSTWLFLSISCINLQNLNRDIHTPFFPLPLSIPPWGVSPQSYSIFFFFTYYHYYSLVQGVWVQGVSPWLILSFSCFNLQNLNTDIKRHILSPPWWVKRLLA